MHGLAIHHNAIHTHTHCSRSELEHSMTRLSIWTENVIRSLHCNGLENSLGTYHRCAVFYQHADGVRANNDTTTQHQKQNGWLPCVDVGLWGTQIYHSKFKLDFGSELARVKLIFISRTNFARSHTHAHSLTSNARLSPKLPSVNANGMQKTYKFRACATH